MSDFQYSVEIAGSCNLRCPSCPVGNIDERLIAKKLIDKNLFYKILDKIDAERAVPNPLISLFDWGEPTLHPNLPDFIKYINKKNMISRISSNLNVDADFDKIISANPHEFKISLSGYYQKTYSRTHSRGNIYKVMQNLYKLKHLKDKYKSSTKIFIGFHVYKHNAKKDFQKYLDLCKELSFIFEPIVAQLMPIEKNLSLIENKYGNIKDKISFKLPSITEQDKNLIDLLIFDPLKEHENWKKSKNNQKDFACKKKDKKLAIRTDGSVPICCGVYGDEFVVVKDFLSTSFDEIQKIRNSYDLCNTCINNGLHNGWQKLKNSFFSRYLTSNTVTGKFLRHFISYKE